MKAHAFEPWMLLADWRANLPPWLLVDLDSWPPDLPITPMPPVPLLGIGTQHHPAAAQPDVLVTTQVEATRLGAAIETNPATAATLVQLLRAIEAAPAPHALTLESLTFAALQASSEHQTWRANHPRTPRHPPGDLTIDRRQNTLSLTLNRPAAHNAINAPLRDALFEAFTLAAHDPEIRRLHLSAAGRAFSIGADLAEFGTTQDPIAAHAIRACTLPAWPLLRRHARFEVHVQGPCIGAGLELAAFADRLTASQNAWFQLPELRMGLIPGFGGCVSIPRRIGRQGTAALLLSGRRITATTALAWGLIDAISDPLPPQK